MVPAGDKDSANYSPRFGGVVVSPATDLPDYVVSDVENWLDRDKGHKIG